MSGAAIDQDESAAVRPSRRAVVLQWGALACVLGAFALALRGSWAAVGSQLVLLSPGGIALGALLTTVATAASFVSWRAILADLGSPVPWLPAARIFFVGQLGKYLPGSVWPVLVQMRLGHRLGVPRRRMAVAFVVTLGLALAWGLLLGLAAVPTLLAGGHARYAWALAALPLLVVFLLPRPVNALLGLVLRAARRPALEHPLSARGLASASLSVLGFWVLAGLSMWVLLVDLGAPVWSTLLVAVGGFGLAFSAGPLLVVLPRGGRCPGGGAHGRARRIRGHDPRRGGRAGVAAAVRRGGRGPRRRGGGRCAGGQPRRSPALSARPTTGTYAVTGVPGRVPPAPLHGRGSGGRAAGTAPCPR